MFNIIMDITGLIIWGSWLFIFAHKLIWRIRLMCTGGRASATVVDITKVNQNRLSAMEYPKLSYNVGETTHTVEYKHVTPLSYYKKGQTVEVAYNKKNMDDIVVLRQRGIIVGYTLMCIPGLFLVGFSIWDLVNTVFF